MNETKELGQLEYHLGTEKKKRIKVDFQTKGRVYIVKKCMILMFLFILLMIASMSFAATENGDFSDFTDVRSNHWAVSFINSLKSTEIISGYPDGTFKPQANVKVNEYIAMTVKALGYRFDAPNDDWAKNYIAKALDLKIITPNQFKDYNAFITRQAMTVVTVNAIVLTEERPSTEYDQFVANSIKDYQTICDFCKQNILDAYKLGITTGYSDKTFRPSLFSTRAEASTLISKIINPDLRDVPKYDFKSTIKQWYWVKEDGEKVLAETNIKRTGVFTLVDDDFYMPVYKGINVTEMYELGKYMNKLSAEAGNSPFYVFDKGQDGFAIYGFKDKLTYTSIFEENNQMPDQVMQIPARFEIILGGNAYMYADYSYLISLDKVNYEKYRSFIEKMIQFQFKQDAVTVINKINMAMATNQQELVKFSTYGRNVQINNTSDHIKIEYSVKYN